MKLVDPEDPFYQPLWRRIVIVVLTGAWAAFEIFIARDGFWGVLFGGIFVFCLWTFLLNWKEQPPKT